MTQLTKYEQKLVQGHVARIMELEEAAIQALLCLQQEPELVRTATNLLSSVLDRQNND